MHKFTRTAAATVFAGSLLLTGGLAPANAQPVAQEGLVNVNVGEVNLLNNANVQAAVVAIVQACDLVDVTGTNVAVLARVNQVLRTGQDRTICEAATGPVTVSRA